MFHRFANPARFLRIARWLTPLLLVSGLLIAGAALAYGLLLISFLAFFPNGITGFLFSRLQSRSPLQRIFKRLRQR